MMTVPCKISATSLEVFTTKHHTSTPKCYIPLLFYSTTPLSCYKSAHLQKWPDTKCHVSYPPSSKQIKNTTVSVTYFNLHTPLLVSLGPSITITIKKKAFTNIKGSLILTQLEVDYRLNGNKLLKRSTAGYVRVVRSKDPCHVLYATRYFSGTYGFLRTQIISRISPLHCNTSDILLLLPQSAHMLLPGLFRSSKSTFSFLSAITVLFTKQIHHLRYCALQLQAGN